MLMNAARHGLAATHESGPRRSLYKVIRNRLLLVLSVVAVPALLTTFGSRPATVEPDLVRLLRFMAVLKGTFAFAAFAACYWRLGRPAALWREVVYIGAPALMTGGALCLWTLQSAWLAAAALHLGLFALLAAGLTDAAFIPALRRRT